MPVRLRTDESKDRLSDETAPATAIAGLRFRDAAPIQPAKGNAAA